MKLTTLALAVLFALSGTAQIYSGHLSFTDDFASQPSIQLAIDANGNHYLADFAIDAFDADFGPDEVMLGGGDTDGHYLLKYDQDWNFLWGHFIPTGGWAVPRLVLDSEENVYLLANYSLTVDFDPSESGEALETSVDVGDPYLLKFSPDGTFQWVQTWGPTFASLFGGGIVLQDLAITSSDELIISGSFTTQVDFDPGAGTSIADTQSNGGFLQRFDNDGTWNGSYTLDESFNWAIHNIEVDANDNIYMNGTYATDIVFDPAPGGTSLEIGANNGLGYVAKQAPDGTVEWAIPQPSLWNFGSASEQVRISPTGNVIVAQNSPFGFDLDPSENVAEVPEPGGNQQVWYLVSYSPDGAYLWHRHAIAARGSEIDLDDDGNIYALTYPEQGVDLDSGPASVIVNPDGTQSIAVAKFSADGTLVWTMLMGNNSNNHRAHTVEVSGNDRFYLSGQMDTDLDLDPSEAEVWDVANPSGFVKPWFAWYGVDACNATVTFNDPDGYDCGAGEVTLFADMVNGTAPFFFDWGTGETGDQISVAAGGWYTVIGEDANGCTSERTLLVDGPTAADNFDLTAGALVTTLTPGFDGQVFVEAANLGCSESPSPTSVTLTLDAWMEVSDVQPAADVVDGSTYTWNLPAQAYSDDNFSAQLAYTLSTDAVLGETVQISTEVSPSAGDANMDNNLQTLDLPVIGAYDPNDIRVWPQGTGEQGFVEPNLEMTYMIRFQNTGSAPAFDVNVHNAIDPNLDIESLRVVAHSHDLVVERLDASTVNFSFPNIMLPDSTCCEPESHGYIIYTIDQQPDLNPLEDWHNSVDIYFDFNEAVVTNTVVNTIIDPFDLVSELDRAALNLYPNPTNGLVHLSSSRSLQHFQVVDLTGKLLLNGKLSGTRASIDLHELGSGMYTLKVWDEQGVVVSRSLIVH